MQMLKGRIVEIEKNVHTGVYVTQGIKKKEQYKYENNPKVSGSNGTYATGHEYYGTTIDVKVYVFDLDRCVSFDIRDYVLAINGKKKVSEKLLNFIIENNKGNKVVLQKNNNDFILDNSQLEVMM